MIGIRFLYLLGDVSSQGVIIEENHQNVKGEGTFVDALKPLML